ncbi:hypothetical protein Lepto7375DRAFT_6472 [Leptolyngbya sp. PCC 7375]|nr:hypothetical protein Lepto7375DRAFT_6472 [Leptolyngbya sp. PCC 7375]
MNVDPTGATVAIKVGSTLLSQARQLAAKSLSKEDVENFSAAFREIGRRSG